MENKLLDLYLNSPQGLSTGKRLYRAAIKEGLSVTLHQVENMLTRFKIAVKFKKKYKKRTKIEQAIVLGPYDIFQLDICFFTKYKNYSGVLIW